MSGVAAYRPADYRRLAGVGLVHPISPLVRRDTIHYEPYTTRLVTDQPSLAPASCELVSLSLSLSPLILARNNVSDFLF